MIVHTSVLMAILLNEPERHRLVRAMIAADRAMVSAATQVECSVVIDRRVGPMTRTRYDQILRQLRVVVAPVTAGQAEIAREAHRRFGRGSGHPASLNFGDCFSYALAVESGESLLFKGDDFAATDLPAVAY